MSTSKDPAQTPTSRTADRRRFLAVLLVLAAAVGWALAGSATGQDLQSELDARESELSEAQDQKGVLTTEISRYSEEINELQGQVAVLRNREARVAEELRRTKAELAREKKHLRVLRARYQRSVEVLEDRLVAIYKSDQPDALTVILQSDGFDDLLDRYEYLDRIEDQDSAIVARVRTLKNETKATVERIRAAKQAIAAKRRELARTRSQLEAREADLSAARSRRQEALSGIQVHIEKLEGSIEGLEEKIQAQLAAAAAASTPAAPATLPAGPVRGAGSGFIWPVNGPVVSGFGMRWGRLHAGIDIAVPAGTPIRAAKAGTIALAAPYGGYGNYTCINHGGGLSTCYAHQSSFAVTSGSVDQGQVIGSVGCTGHCFGDHLHFEVRVNGTPVDPLGYL